MKRFGLVFISLLIAIGAVLLAAKHPTGPNTVSYDDPNGLWLSIGLLVIVFLPPLILSFFSNRAVRMINGIYLTLIVITFLAMVPIGFFVPELIAVGIIGLLGAITTGAGLVMTIKTDLQKSSFRR